MNRRRFLVGISAASVAFAQAPGEADLAPPGMAPAVFVAPPPPPIRRLSVGLGIGGIDLAPHSAPDATTSFSLGQIAWLSKRSKRKKPRPSAYMTSPPRSRLCGRRSQV